jgi:hypothetical protein
MNAKQFAWIYLIENGKAGCEPSYYGGWNILDDFDDMKYKKLSPWDGSLFKAIREDSLAALRKIGVDWDKTKSPTSSLYSEFNGTFADSSSCEYLKGTLVLLDGSEQHWIAESIEVSNVFEMMEQVSQGADKFEKIFRTKANSML